MVLLLHSGMISVKILPLGGTIFFSEGDYSADGPLGFNAYEIARSIYDYQRRPISLNKLASDWATEVAPRIAGVAAVYPNAFIDRRTSGNIIQGIFIGYENSTNALVVRAAIAQSFTISLMTIPGQIPITPEHGLIFTPGHQDITDEFTRGRESIRAKARIDDVEERSAGKTRGEIGAMKAAMIVQATADWTSDSRTGGEIASIVFERGQQWRWVHKPSFCPDS